MERKKLVVLDTELTGRTIPLLAFQQEVIGWIDEIPAEYLAGTEIEFPEGWHDGEYAEVQVRYWRPETDAEIAERRLNEQARELQRRHYDLQTLARLKAQYPDAK